MTLVSCVYGRIRVEREGRAVQRSSAICKYELRTGYSLASAL